MNKIGFLTYFRFDNIQSKSTRNKLKNFYKYAIQNIEDDINGNGGIAGKNIFIDLLDLPVPFDQGKEAYKNKLANSPSILFAKGPTIFTGVYEKKVSYIKSIESKQRLLFTDVNIHNPTGIDILPNNIILSSAPVLLSSKPGDVFERNKEFFQAERLFHFANIAKQSPIRLREKELLDKNIYLNFIDPEKDTIIENLEEKMLTALKDSTEKDLLSIGAMNVALKNNIFYICKKHNLPPKIFFSSADNTSSFDFSDLSFAPIFQTSSNFDIYLKMEHFIENAKLAFDITEKQIINNHHFQFEIPYLIKQITDDNHLHLTDHATEDFINQIKVGLNKIDGEKEIFVGTSDNYAFQDNKNILKGNRMVQALSSKKQKSLPLNILHPKQLIIEDEEYKTISVTYIYIDVLKVNNISIENGTFSCDMYLDIISEDENPLKLLRFNNLSAMNSKFETEKIGSHADNKTNVISTRYHVIGNFDFYPIASNYPFDSQYLYLAVRLIDGSAGMLQPIPEELIDTNFELSGWVIKDTKSGILRSKNYLSKSTTLERIARVEEEVRVGWLIQRASSMTVLKIGVPLFFLSVLVYYTLFLPIDEIADSMAYLTTAFLSGIALYFSTERPEPLVMTTIDHIFAFFYFMTGGSMVLVIFAKFLPEIYNFLIMPLRFFIPLGLIVFLAYLSKRVRSKKFKPNLLQS